MASKYDKKAIIQNLMEQREISPNEYDGAYELARGVIRAYADRNDYSDLNYLDLNLVYLMVIITSRHSIDRKKDAVNASHLAESEKIRLKTLLDNVWERANRREYLHSEEDSQIVVGMFGTGFYSFQNKTDDKCAREFIRMCVDIALMNDEDAIFDRAEQVLNGDFRGMKAASASVVLHCLKPTVFPILNGNSGFDNIFEAAGVKLKKKGELETYIPNCRMIKAFRDSQFDFKNYRVFDLAARSIDEYLIDKKGEFSIDIEKLKAAIDGYKNNISQIVEEENYKWEAVKCFQDNFDIEATDFAEMLARSLEKEENLLSRQNFFARRVIVGMAQKYPEDVREMFRHLYDETIPLLDRIQQFEDSAEILYFKDHEKSLNTYQDAKATTVYLFFRYPEKHYIYLSMKFENAAKQVGYDNIPKHGKMERILAYYDMADQIYRYVLTDDELINLNRNRITEKCYQDPQNHVLVEDIVYYLKRSYNQEHKSEEQDNDEYFPSLDDYNPGLTAEQYEECFTNSSLIRKGWLDTVYYLYRIGGEGTCKQIAMRFGSHPSHYINHANTVAKKIVDATDCPVMERDTKNSRYWPVLFFGKGNTEGAGVYIWKLREPVKEAIKSMESKGFFEQVDNLVDYPKNMILYGPPGTGKTYHTMIYAVAIVEGRELEEVEEETRTDYESVKSRYNSYMDKGQVAFTTFHQSYGYEEFIEGIKPVMDAEETDSDDVRYEIREGVFKAFCERAITPIAKGTNDQESLGLNKNPEIWKVSLDGTGDNPTRDECMQNNHIRIGWDKYGEQITDETEFSGGQKPLNAFINKMQIGDIVLSCYSASEIDAIGVIIGDYEWHPEYDNLKRLRKVNWIVKGLRHNIIDINGGRAMTLSTVYRMNKVSLSDVLQIIDEYQGGSENSAYKRSKDRFVFVIDEINRGNISKVFGELITLIEPSKRIGESEEMKLTLPYSSKDFGVPNNVYIIGTMNTADRSIALMDTALRRRFDFVPMMPDAQLLNTIDEIEGVNIAEMLRKINDRIEVLMDREHMIGHSYFMKLLETPTLDCLGGIFKNNVIPLLQEYFYDDYEKIRLILGDNQKPEELQFITRRPIDKMALFGQTDEELDIEDIYTIHEDVIERHAEAYIGIYQNVELRDTNATDVQDQGV